MSISNSKRVQHKREALRQSLQGQEYLRRISIILEADDWGSRVQEYNGKLTAYFKLLAKCLPDLKSVEYSGEINLKQEIQEMPDAELRERITGIAAKAGFEFTDPRVGQTH